MRGKVFLFEMKTNTRGGRGGALSLLLKFNGEERSFTVSVGSTHTHLNLLLPLCKNDAAFQCEEPRTMLIKLFESSKNSRLLMDYAGLFSSSG